MRKLAIILLVLAASSCGKKDVSLLNLLPAQSTVNPLTRDLFGYPEARLYDVEYYGNGHLEGASSSTIFKTENYFQSFSLSSITNYRYSFEEVTKAGRNYLHIEQPNANNININYSHNFGKDWQVFNFIIDGSTPSGYLSRYEYIDETHIVLLMNFPGGSVYTTSVYQVDLQTTQAILLSTLPDFIANEIHVRDNNIWITSTYGTVVHSLDTGATWSAPSVIKNGIGFEITSGSNNDLFAYATQVQTAFFSSDGGNTWTETSAYTANFQWVDYADAKTIYALNNYDVQKSTDGGSTWITIRQTINNLSVWGVPRFIDAQQGILWSAENIFLTEDGGETWHILLAKSYVQ